MEIELKNVLSETSRRNYEKIRLTRLKYKDNPYYFIDIRLFQRGFDDEGNEIFYPTKKGVQFKEKDFQRLIGKWTIIPSLVLHPIIKEKCWDLVTYEKFDDAIFNAYKSIEVRIRDLSKLDPNDVGVKLVRKAFNKISGPLTDMSIPTPERESIANLFCGAIGRYKNPHSHRNINSTFPETLTALMLASNLHSILDEIENKKRDKIL